MEGIILNAGKYWLGLMQKQGFMSLGYNNQTAEANTIWQKPNALGSSPWTKIDTVGQLLVIANFGPRIISSNTKITQAENRLHLYPNPVHDQLVVEWTGFKPNDRVQVFNSLGQKITEEHVTSSQFVLPTNRLSKGIYSIRIGKLIGRFVKE